MTLNRPEKLNSLTRRMFSELSHFWQTRGEDPDCRVIIVAGAGRAFCAGADIAEMEETPHPLPEGAAEEMVRRESRIHDIVLFMRRCPQPLIAAVHGWAAGGGFSLAMACDLRVMDVTAKLAASFINVGLSGGDMGSSFNLPRQTSLGLSIEALMTGEPIPADRAGRMGLANHVVPQDRHLAKAREIAEKIARRPLPLLAEIKRALMA